VWLLLCNSTDRTALWAAGRLRAQGLNPLRVLTPELLHYSLRWEHRLHSGGATFITFTLADGTRIDGAEIRGVLNRVSFVPTPLVGHLVEADRLYAQQEWTALHMSWLASLRAPVLNLPMMEGLCGAWRHQSEWVWLAGQAGLDTGGYVQSAPAVGDAVHAKTGAAVVSVTAIDGRGIGKDVRDGLADACGRLGVLARTRLLGVQLDARSGTFVSASPLPDLYSGGEAVIDALASRLRAG
jgi:hypothetical protein